VQGENPTLGDLQRGSKRIRCCLYKMPHETWKPNSQTSFKAKEDSQAPHFVGTYHLGGIATQWYQITPFLFEYATL